MSKQKGKSNRSNNTNHSNPVSGQSVFNYTSVCCSKRAKKAPCQRSPEDIKENKPSECGLGVWRCEGCNQKCKVKRVKNTPETVA